MASNRMDNVCRQGSLQKGAIKCNPCKYVGFLCVRVSLVLYGLLLLSISTVGKPTLSSRLDNINKLNRDGYRKKKKGT